jgi:tetratricopeptide (TPR) repeat protein
LFLALAAGTLAVPCAAQQQPRAGRKVEMSAAQLFAYADAARDRGDYATAEAAYKALTHDPDLELRTEARFRLAEMYTNKLGKHREAAVLLRRILDDKPDAAAVRLELARVDALLGNFHEARRELRAAEATGLPPAVEQQVRFFSNALTALKRFGGGLQVSLAPSTNINRATSSDTLGTIIGDFTLSKDAQAQSGVGLSLQGQAYARLPLGTKTDLLLRASSSADIYRKSEFDDMILSLQAGPQWISGKDRLSLAAAASWRWYGLDPYTFDYGATGNWQHPLGKKTQLRIDGTVLKGDNRRNDLESGERYTLAVGLDHAFSARFGGGLQVNGTRQVAQDPGYSTVGGGANLYLYRELGRSTAVLNFGYRHLEADKRLFLYPERRKDDDLTAGLSGTFRALTVGTFAPIAKVSYERNWSTVGIYDFHRISAELGVTAAF